MCAAERAPYHPAMATKLHNEQAPAESEAAGGARYGRMPYWSLPGAVVADPAQLVTWGRRSLDHARATKKPKK